MRQYYGPDEETGRKRAREKVIKAVERELKTPPLRRGQRA